MRFTEFEAVAREEWNDIPARFKSGVDGLIVEHDARPHDEDPEVFTMGECVTEEFPSDYGGPDTIRSAVVLYYGSFRAVAADDEAFDWRDEIHETILHELQHHLESLATEDSLEDVDYAVNENFKRVRGDAFDPLFYRAGGQRAINAVNAVNAFEVDGDVFVEVRAARREPTVIDWEWEGVSYRAPLAVAEADVTYHYVDNGPDIGDHDFCIVRVVKQGILSTLRSALGRGYTVEEVTVRAERAE